MAKSGDVDTLAPWTIKAMSVSARKVVVRAAQVEGVTIAEWIEARVREWAEQGVSGHKPQSRERRTFIAHTSENAQQVDDLCRLVEAACKLGDQHAYAPRKTIGEFQIELWLPSIDAEEGRMPMVPGIAVKFLFPRVGEARANGGAMFQMQPVHRPEVTYLVGVAAWLESEADKTWRMAMEGYEALHLSLAMMKMYRYPPLARPPLPWCLLMRTPLLSTCPQGQLSGIVKALPSLIWALIESGSGPE